MSRQPPCSCGFTVDRLTSRRGGHHVRKLQQRRHADETRQLISGRAGRGQRTLNDRVRLRCGPSPRLRSGLSPAKTRVPPAGFEPATPALIAAVDTRVGRARPVPANYAPRGPRDSATSDNSSTHTHWLPDPNRFAHQPRARRGPRQPGPRARDQPSRAGRWCGHGLRAPCASVPRTHLSL